MYKLSETEVLAQPTEYVNENDYKVWNYETGVGDGGFLDTFNALKYQIDFNYSQYKEQLRGLLLRQKKLKDDYHTSIKLFFIVTLIPLFYYLFIQLIIFLGLRIDLFAFLYTILILFLAPLVFVCDMLFPPALLRNIFGYKRQIELLCSGPEDEAHRKKRGIVSFDDEKIFLKNTIMKYDSFYEDMIIEGWDKKDNDSKWKNVDSLSDEQREILDRMRTLSLFKEYKASVVETRKDMGVGWLIVCFCIALGVGLFLYAMGDT